MMKTRDDFFKELGTWPILTAQYFDEFFPENNLSLCSCWLQKPMPRFAYHRVPGSFAAFRLIKPAFTEEQLPSVSVTSVVELKWAEISKWAGISWNQLEWYNRYYCHQLKTYLSLTIIFFLSHQQVKINPNFTMLKYFIGRL